MPGDDASVAGTTNLPNVSFASDDLVAVSIEDEAAGLVNGPGHVVDLLIGVVVDTPSA